MTSTDSVTSGPRTSTDFDFLVGTWDVEHHRLVAPLTGSTEWVVSGDSRAAGYTYLDGGVSVDEITFPSAGASGMSLRLYSADRDEWSIFWVSSHDGRVGPPVHGRWEGESGERRCRLVGDELPQGGRPTLLRRCRRTTSRRSPRTSTSSPVPGGSSTASCGRG